ncbi:hypothetical protein OROGR_006697 [Orobanche gracilis]
MQSMKETAANIAASTKSGMEKTRATVQEKMERVTAHNPTEKEMATERKEERVHNAELNKLEEREHNAAARQAGHADAHGSHSYAAARMTGQPTGGHQMSALPGHGTGHPTGQVTEGLVKSHPIGTATGTGRTTAHNTHVGGGANTGHGTGGGGYSG